MASRRIMNASPLIFLSRVALLEMLQEPGVDVMVPDVVAQEIAARGPGDPTVHEMNRTPWLRVVPAPRTPHTLLPWNLGSGESGVLSLALGDPECEVILDDRAARRCARSLGIPFQGTLSLVLLARQTGRIPTARPVLEQLRRSGMYLSDRVLEMALAHVGESRSNP